MKKKTPLTLLIEWADEYYELHKSSPKQYDLQRKITELLPVEKAGIAEAFQTGHINGWVDGSHDKVEQSLKGEDYFTNTFGQ